MQKIKEDNPHSGHRERLRKRFQNEGLKNFEEHNVLELLLFYSIPYKDTNVLAHDLISRFGSLKGVFDAPIEELVTVNGISDRSAVLIKLMSQIAYKYYSDKGNRNASFRDTNAIGQYLVKEYIGCKRETVMMITLNCNNQIISQKVISEGDVSSASFSIRKVVEEAILSDAFSVVLAHNHPNGNLVPSHDDLIATANIRKVLETSKIFFKEHFIICGNKYLGIESKATGMFVPPVPKMR